jgi:nucleoside-diphosphate-sugar epimerase
MRDTFADTARAKADLGFAPSKSLESGLADESDWLARRLVVTRS